MERNLNGEDFDDINEDKRYVMKELTSIQKAKCASNKEMKILTSTLAL